MCMLSILTPPRKRAKSVGRPKVADDRVQRRRHVAAAIDHVGRGLSLSQVARLHGTTKSTVRRWVRLALTYDDEPCEGLRRLLASTEPPA